MGNRPPTRAQQSAQFQNAKPFYLSVGVMSPLISLVVILLRTFYGIDLDEALVSQIVANGADVYNLVIAIIGQLGGIWGRIRAKTAIGSAPPS